MQSLMGARNHPSRTPLHHGRLTMVVGLWFALVFPSLFIVHKLFGWGGAAAYIASVSVLLVALQRFTAARLSDRSVAVLGLSTLFAVVLVFLLVYPVENVHVPGHGSDDDDAYNVGVQALAAGSSPYHQRTYLGNVLHQLPGAFVLASPFVAMGTSAWQNIFWLAMFFGVVYEETRDSRWTLRLAWTVLVLSPTVMHQVVTGTAYVANTIYVALGLWWLTRTRHLYAASAAWGIALASRANFLFLVPLAGGWLDRTHGRRAAISTMCVACGVAAALTLPFYFFDPQQFGPLEARDRVFRFDALVPHLGSLILLGMALLSVGCSAQRMTRATLFRNAALVQALPIMAGFILSSMQTGHVNPSYTAYGAFFAWFVFLEAAISFRDPAR